MCHEQFFTGQRRSKPRTYSLRHSIFQFTNLPLWLSSPLLSSTLNFSPTSSCISPYHWPVISIYAAPLSEYPKLNAPQVRDPGATAILSSDISGARLRAPEAWKISQPQNLNKIPSSDKRPRERKTIQLSYDQPLEMLSR